MMTNLVGPIAASLLAFNQLPLPDPSFSSVLLVHEFAMPDDLSSNAQAVTFRIGTAQHNCYPDTSKKKFGNQSAYFLNQNAALRVGGYAASNAINDLGTGNWTIEFWFARNSEPSATGYFYGNWRTLNDRRHMRIGYNPTTNAFTIEVSPTGTSSIVSASFDCDTDGVTVATAFDGNFHHIAVVRNGADLDIYVDGIRGSVRGNIAANGVYYPTANDAYPVNIGCATNTNSGTQPDNGVGDFWMDEFRITKGVARYSGTSFSVPTTRFGRSVGDDPDFASVTVLLDFEGYWGPVYYGNQGLTVGRIGLGIFSDFDFYRDGLALTAANTGQLIFQDTVSPDWGFGSGDFCVELFGVKGSFTSGRTWVGNYGNVNGERGWAVRTGGTSNSFLLEYTTDGITPITVSCGASLLPVTASASLDSATEYDLCVERQGTNLRFFVNGFLVRTVGFTDTIFDPGAANNFLSILCKTSAAGARQDAYSGELKGVRVTRAARYGGSNYTPPTLPLPKS